MAVDLKLLGKKLQRYRSQLDLSLDDVSSATGIAAASLADFEAGKIAPTGDHILVLADYFKCDYAELISSEAQTSLERTDTLFRRFGNEFSKADRWAVREFLFLCESEHFLNQQLNKRTTTFGFQKSGTFFKGHAAQAAKQLRMHLSYEDHALPRDVYADFRSVGIHVFRRRLHNSNISGLYVNHPVAGDCVLINYSEDVYRQRFTAAHEAAHAIFDREEEVVVSFWNADDLKEIRANAFASRYLMPPEFLRKIPQPKSWDREKLVRLAQDMRVNPRALLNALSGEGLIEKTQQDVFTDAKIATHAKIDPELPDSLAPRSRERKEALLQRGLSSGYVSLCFDAYRNNLVTASRLAELLLLDGDEELRELAALYGEPVEHAA
jgi:Zn-dependent peptidase ImmA (M78 family)/transcriptional regulator with XRE-family HTH domain